MQRWRRRHHLVWESESTSCSTPGKISQRRTFSVSFCHWRAFASRSTHSLVEVDMTAWPSLSILRASCYQWSPRVGMLALSSLTMPNNCARVWRILALRWPKIVFLFYYAHQINLLVKDVIATNWQITVFQAHAIVSTLNKSTVKWLSRLRDIMKATYGYTLALVQMADM